ncbi:hypothetical protein ACFJIX_17905 [Roseateles sp. UC29_93]|uniref:hypothetical protein n=1 Tax=Roseateles sp. UC29_93 TaxID=3350177 RepID=UPI003671A4B4
MKAIHLSLRLSDGSRRMMQMLADSTGAALALAQATYGDALRGGSARALRAPGIVGTVANGRAAANDEHFAEVMS